MIRHRSLHGLTLIEILVATTLVAFLIATATAGFVQMRTLARRVDARQQLHNSARLLYERLGWEISCMMQGSAFFAIGTSTGTIELVFLRGKLDNTDFMQGSSYGVTSMSLSDQLWTRWSYDKAAHEIKLAASSPSRSFDQDVSWVSGGYDYKSGGTKSYFRNLPTPQRVVRSSSPMTTLDANAYGTGATGDIGDYTNLLNNAVSISTNCSNLTLEVYCQDGSHYPISTNANNSVMCDGQMIDGRAGASLAMRPRLIRTTFELTDYDVGISETFIFSFPAPALALP